MADREREGYVLIDRNILDWKWWQKHNTVIIFLWLLLKAQFHESFFSGIKLKRGQLATTIGNIGSANKYTIQEVRTALNSLKSTGEITIERHPRFLVITIVNYNRYQNLTIKSTIKQQSNNNQTTIEQQYTNTYNTDNTLERSNARSTRNRLPRTIEEIVPERDLVGCPPFEDMPNRGSKRMIPQRVRKLFDGDYDAFWRYMERCHTKSR